MSGLVTHAIVAHTSRRSMAQALSMQTQGRIFWDDGSLGEQRNHARALAWLAGAPTPWVTLLEDDALPCPAYLDAQARCLADAPPHHLVSEYLGTGRWAGTHPQHHAPRVRALVARAERTGQRWITAAELWHAVAVSLPVEAAAAAVPDLGGHTPTDQALTRWASRAGWRVAYAWPSLVDHADTPTVTAHPDAQPRVEQRRAWRVKSSA